MKRLPAVAASDRIRLCHCKFYLQLHLCSILLPSWLRLAGQLIKSPLPPSRLVPTMLQMREQAATELAYISEMSNKWKNIKVCGWAGRRTSQDRTLLLRASWLPVRHVSIFFCRCRCRCRRNRSNLCGCCANACVIGLSRHCDLSVIHNPTRWPLHALRMTLTPTCCLTTPCA